MAIISSIAIQMAIDPMPEIRYCNCIIEIAYNTHRLRPTTVYYSACELSHCLGTYTV